MILQIGQFASSIMLIALIAKMFDWYMTVEEKSSLQQDVHMLLETEVITPASVVKFPLYIFIKLLDVVLGEKAFSLVSLRRSVVFCSLLLFSCLLIGGAFTNTFLGFTKTPWSTYDSELSSFEEIIDLSRADEVNEEETQVLQEHYSKLKRLIEVAHMPFWKGVYIFMVLGSIFFIGIGMTLLSLTFSRKITVELQKTDSLILIVGAICLSTVVSILLFIITLITLYFLSSSFVFFSSTFISLISSSSTLLGGGLAIGVGIMSWFFSSVWVKAIALGAIVPCGVIIILSLLSSVLYPFRRLIGAFINSFILRAVQSEKGVLIFIATGLTLLSGVILIVTNIFLG